MNTATTAAPLAAELPPGTVIDGTYTTGAVVRARLGAVTYEARDASGARVDVTVYAPECFVSPVALERSLRELRQIEKVDAPQVRRTRDAGKLGKGGIYEVHEHLAGDTLAEIGAIPREQVGELIHEIVAGLQAAQKVGVLHRNLGAETIVRVGQGIKLTGFAVGDPQGGVSFGALDCIAPEQVEGRNIDERTLVYNLAALTYRLLRGASLFTGGDTGTQLLQAAASLPPSESMPPALFAALAKDPKARPNLLSKFLAELDGIVRDFPEGLVDEPTSTPPEPAHDEDGPPPAPLFSLDPLADPEEQSRPSAVREAPLSDPTTGLDPAPAARPTRSEERDEDATLDALMTDHDAPKLPSPAAKAGPDAVSPAPVSPPAASAAPAVTPPAAAKPPGLGAPPTLSKPAPTLTPPPAIGKAAPPSFGPPAIGKPGAPSVTPPTLSAPTLSPPTLAAPNLSAPSLTPPSASPPTATPAPQAGAAKPRTRGWTMFMEVTEDEANAPAAPGQAQAPAPVAPAAAAAAAPTPTPAAPTPATPGGEVKPSTRGWTMIMDEPSEADAAALALTTPAAAATPPPPSPTTRGWTMLEELNDSLPAGAAPVTPAPAQPAAGIAQEVSTVSNAPSSRGWTMFMEAELQGPKPEEASAEPGDAEPEFFDGPVQTESGTVVAFAPTAAEPNSSFRREPEPPAEEPMTSFGARLRGEDKPSGAQPEDEVPQPRSTPLESAPSPSAEIPSFAGNNLGFVPVNPDKPVQRPPLEPDPVQEADAPETTGGSNKAVIIGAVVVLLIIVAVILATRG